MRPRIYVEQDGTSIVDDAAASGARYRPTGDVRWESSWRPAAFNRRLDVYQATPPPLPYRVSIASLPLDTVDLHLSRRELSMDDIEMIARMTRLSRLELTSCTFPSEWNSCAWKALERLAYLGINNPRTFALEDGMQGLSTLPALKVLRLIRCDFFNDDTYGPGCYDALRDGGFPTLTHLDLSRTLTREKVLRTEGEVDPIVMDTLNRLVHRPGLATMNISWCSALTDEQQRSLVEQGSSEGREVIVSAPR